MYNRYIRDQQGAFTRIHEDASEHVPPPPPPCDAPCTPSEDSGNNDSFLHRILGKFGADSIDSGDLLLLLILFLLFSEGEGRDEELLIALGLLLIL